MILPFKMSRKLWDSLMVGDILVHTISHKKFKIASVERYNNAVFEIESDRGETLRYSDEILKEIIDTCNYRTDESKNYRWFKMLTTGEK